jgi:hypothetical protein
VSRMLDPENGMRRAVKYDVPHCPTGREHEFDKRVVCHAANVTKKLLRW